MNVRVASRVPERLKIRNFKKIPEMPGFDPEYPVGPPKARSRCPSVNYCKNWDVKYPIEKPIEKPILLNFVNLST